MAAAHGHLPVVQHLVEHDVTALDHQSLFQPSPSHVAATHGHVDVVTYLLGRGASPFDCDYWGTSLVDIATQKDSPELLRALHPYGVCASRNNQQGRTCLHEAAILNSGRVLQALLDLGHSPDQRDSLGNAPLHLAACRGNVWAVEVLTSAGATLSAANTQGQQPLHLATREGHTPVMSRLLQKGCQVDCTDIHGRTCVDYTVQSLKLGLLSAARAACVIAKLLEAGARLGEVQPAFTLHVLRLPTGSRLPVLRRLAWSGGQWS